MVVGTYLLLGYLDPWRPMTPKALDRSLKSTRRNGRDIACAQHDRGWLPKRVHVSLHVTYLGPGRVSYILPLVSVCMVMYHIDSWTVSGNTLCILKPSGLVSEIL